MPSENLENKLELARVSHINLSNNIVQDPEFYFADGNLHVLVRDTDTGVLVCAYKLSSR
jgi:hypothetical protein